MKTALATEMKLTKSCDNPCCNKMIGVTVMFCSTKCLYVEEAIEIIQTAIRDGYLTRVYAMEKIEEASPHDTRKRRMTK